MCHWPRFDVEMTFSSQQRWRSQCDFILYLSGRLTVGNSVFIGYGFIDKRGINSDLNFVPHDLRRVDMTSTSSTSYRPRSAYNLHWSDSDPDSSIPIIEALWCSTESNVEIRFKIRWDLTEIGPLIRCFNLCILTQRTPQIEFWKPIFDISWK